MDKRQLQYLKSIILDRLREEKDPEKKLDNIIVSTVDPLTGKALSSKEKRLLKEMVQNDLSFRMLISQVEILRPSFLQDQRVHTLWYEEWLAKHSANQDRYYWHSLSNHLNTALRKNHDDITAANIIKSTDIATDSIISSMESPDRPLFSSKGLVIGHVQSGKTANFTALIAKAVDCGYRMIVVLAGLHDVLRTQTQIRLDKELTGINDRGLPDNEFVEIPPDLRRWERLTNASLEVPGEFTRQGRDPFKAISLRTTPILVVIKKNVRVMAKLNQWISDTSNHVERSLMPLLVIDDEADQASINTRAADPNTDPTRTNEEIRSLLTLFARNSYIAYTATPFANFFIDKEALSKDLYADLYPRNFIYSLPEPKGYHGSARIFNSESSIYHVKFVLDSELILPSEDSPETEVVESLEEAILSFFLGCSVRTCRGDGKQSMSMLIHISHRIKDQNQIYMAVRDYLKGMAFKMKSERSKMEVQDRFKNVWEDFKQSSMEIAKGLELDYNNLDFNQVWTHLDELLKKVSVLELNSSSDDILDYNANPDLKVIAIGGNTLSRGLTLEGLMCSYFTRNAGGYDTLLQMGRWFGFRKNYEDLTRVFTTPSHWDYFSHLAIVEEEVRNSISRYEEEGVTPENLPVLVRGHLNLNVTSRNKLGSAQIQQSGFNGSVTQTTRFPLDKPDKLKSNLDLAGQFISILSTLKDPAIIQNNYVWKDINWKIPIHDFLREYYEEGSGLNLDDCLAYIMSRIEEGELVRWSIGVISNKLSEDSIDWSGLKVSPVHRSRLIAPPGIYNLGVVDDKGHRRLDLIDGEERSTTNALMNIYRISKDSETQKRSANRVPLYHNIDTEKMDVIGIAIILPRSPNAPAGWWGQEFSVD